MTKLSGVKEHRQTLSLMRMSILHGANSLLAATDRYVGVPILHVDYYNENDPMWLNDPFRNSGLREMLGGKDCRAVDISFPIIGAYIDRATWFEMLQI